MTNPLVWPICVLNPMETAANLVPFTRGGGRSLGGIERTVRTDRGYWSIGLRDISVRSQVHKQTWNAIRVALGGRQGLIAVVVKSWDSAPYASQGTQRNAPVFERRIETVHDDGTPHSDGSLYDQGAIDIKVEYDVPLGATSVTLRQTTAASHNLSGIRFSYQHALYETGAAISISGADGTELGVVWTVPIFPAARAPIPAGARPEFERPTCLCHLADDRGMDISQGLRLWTSGNVDFVEATDVWNDSAGIPIWP